MKVAVAGFAQVVSRARQSEAQGEATDLCKTYSHDAERLVKVCRNSSSLS
jgi:hypothetical protein